MTEVPEHLLERSRARRAALGLGGESDIVAASTPRESAAVEPASATAPAAAPAATPATETTPAPPPPPPRIPPFVQAAMERPHIPYWVMPVLVMLPIWALVYGLTLDKPTAQEAGPLTEGATVYGSCSSCHGASGGGGVGPAFTGGAVLTTFPKAADQLHWVMLGTQGFKDAGISTYGAQSKPVDGGGNMPGWSTLTAEELIAVVRHERETLGGAKPTAAELTAEYDEIMAMVKENFPAREAEFQAVVDKWKLLPPEL